MINWFLHFYYILVFFSLLIFFFLFRYLYRHYSFLGNTTIDWISND